MHKRSKNRFKSTFLNIFRCFQWQQSAD